MYLNLSSLIWTWTSIPTYNLEHASLSHGVASQYSLQKSPSFSEHARIKGSR